MVLSPFCPHSIPLFIRYRVSLAMNEKEERKDIGIRVRENREGDIEYGAFVGCGGGPFSLSLLV